jgi:putative ABC transport system permease protein
MTSGWRLALRNLARNKRRNFATGMAIALGFAALLALGGYVNRVEKYLRNYTIYGARTGHIVIYKKEGFEKFSVRPKVYSLSESDQAKIKDVLARTPGIDMHGGQLTGQGLVGNGCRTYPFLALGLEPLLEKRLREHPLVKRWTPTVKDFSKGRGIWEYPEEVGAVALANGLAKILGKGKVLDDFPSDHRPVIVADCLASNVAELISGDSNVQLAGGTWDGMMSALDGEVVANYNTGVTETNNSAILTSLTHLQKLYDTTGVTLWAVWLEDLNKTGYVADQLRSTLKEAGVDVDIYTWLNEDVAPFYSGTMSFLRTMVGFITIILSTVVILSIFNSSTMTVIERSQEIGMMRSLGYTRGQIRKLFVQEVFCLTIISTAVGAVFAVLGIFFVNALKIQFRPPGIAGGIQLVLEPNVETVLAATILVISLSLLTTVIAVRKMVSRPITMLLMGSNR